MARLTSTATRGKVGYTKKQHHAGAGKIRCQGCKIGMAVLKQMGDGKRKYVCDRCGREYDASPI